MSRKRIVGVIILTFIFIFVTIAGYLYFSDIFSKDKVVRETVQDIQDTEDLSTLRIYYPYENSLQQEERKIQRRIGHIPIAEATIEEFLKGPAVQQSSLMPKDVSLIGVYKGADMILYVNLSDEFRRNFQGDALTEFLILKGLYESIISNVEDIHDVKILIEGKEVETLGGHLYLLYPLKDIVSIDLTSQEVENIQQNPQKPE